MTMPAPSLPRPVEAEERELRTATERAGSRPDSARESRPETDRRDIWEREVDREDEREDEREAAEEPAEPSPPGPPGGFSGGPSGGPPPPGSARGGPARLAAETTGASPQVSQ
ncbi:hypothetical protein [Streptomyces aidingensis]|uniref:hypothetical protein n=1 Tax=Streptomyces aidingensis TaxID=910347 RepID=UPI003CCBC1A8